MNNILSNIFKGLLVSLVLVVVAGFLSLNMKTVPNNSMVLVSSSFINSIKTKEKKEEIKKEKIEEPLVEETPIVEVQEEVKEQVQEEIKEEVPVPKKETVVETSKSESVSTSSEPVGTYTPDSAATSSSEVLATYTGLVTAYGPDCTGCYGAKTAMGDYVGEGNIYYNHPTYGTIRIVAGDRSILNKVVRITGLNISSEPVIAIVRDTGGDIGFDKPKGIILDLLYTSERSSEVLNFGMQQATVEVLR